MRKDPRPGLERIEEIGFSVKKLRVGAVPEQDTTRTDSSHSKGRAGPAVLQSGGRAAPTSSHEADADDAASLLTTTADHECPAAAAIQRATAGLEGSRSYNTDVCRTAAAAKHPVQQHAGRPGSRQPRGSTDLHDAIHPAGRMDLHFPARSGGEWQLDIAHTPECGGEGGRKRRRRRKGNQKKRRRNPKVSASLTIFHSNIQGFKSKCDSQEKILDIVKPDVVNLNETNVKGRNKVLHKGFHSFCRNRKETQHMGGVSTSVTDDLKPYAVKVKECEEEDEFLITRLEHVTPPINIINVYGEIESRCKVDEIQARFDRLKKELDRIRINKEGCVLLGDLNKAVGADNLGVKGNKPTISYGGHLIRNLVETKEYFLANNTPEAEGGPFTREEPGDVHLPWERRRKSCLDLILISANLRPFYSSLLIDSRRKITPKQVMMRRGKLVEKPIDHYSLLLKLKNLPRSGIQQKKEIKWKLMKQGGWAKYKELSDDKAVSIERVVKGKDLSVEEATEKIEKIETKLKFQAFGKCSITGRQGRGFQTNSIQREERGRVPSPQSTSHEKGGGEPSSRKESLRTQPSTLSELNQMEEILARQTLRLEKEIKKIKDGVRGRCGQIFKISQAVQVPKNPGPEAHSVKDPKTGELVVSTKEIQKVFLNHCKEVLESNPVVEGFEEEIELKEKLNEIRMLEHTGHFEATKEAFERVVEKFRKNNK